MPPRTEATVRKATEPDLEVGLICADRDGNRIRIDRIDTDTDTGIDVARRSRTVSYHFLNDELRVQEGIQERSIEQFLKEGWYTAAPGRSLCLAGCLKAPPDRHKEFANTGTVVYEFFMDVLFEIYAPSYQIDWSSPGGISDVDPRSISGTISGALPPLSPGTWARLWLRHPVQTRVMGRDIAARKESHGGGCAPRDTGSGLDDKGSGRLKTLFCEARRCRVGLLAQQGQRQCGKYPDSIGSLPSTLTTPTRSVIDRSSTNPIAPGLAATVSITSASDPTVRIES